MQAQATDHPTIIRFHRCCGWLQRLDGVEDGQDRDLLLHLLRCQLVHGASTYNSQLNRKSLNRCIAMLNHLLPAMLTVWIDHGADEDWGPMCYPPQG